jgi:hypothetical protein
MRSLFFRRLVQNFFATFLFLFVTAISPSLAQAQSADWVVNVSDTGFDPTVAGGTITYQVFVDNNFPTASPPTTINLSIPADTVFTGLTGGFTGCLPAAPCHRTRNGYV